MKRILLIFLTLLCGLGAVAQDDYQPLVRDGYRWVNWSMTSVFDYNLEDWVDTVSYYVYEIRGTKTLNGKEYYQVFRDSMFQEQKNIDSQSPIAYLRETDLGVYTYVGLNFPFSNYPEKEILLYDFSSFPDSVGVLMAAQVNDFSYYDMGIPKDYWYSGDSVVEGINYKTFVYHLDDNSYKDSKIIEGVGACCEYSGDLLCPMVDFATGMNSWNFGLCYLEDPDGKIVFKGPHYDEYVEYVRQRADQNGDTQVDLTDMSMVIDTLLRQADSPKADINGDGVIDIVDLNMLINLILE